MITHFSWWKPWTWDWGIVGARLSQDILQTIGKRVRAPTCSGDVPPYVAQVVTDANASDPLRSCAQTKAGVLDVELANNRSYGMIMTYGAPVSWGWHDTGTLTQQLADLVIDKFVIHANELYLPPLGSSSVGVPDSPFSFVVFPAAPSLATITADLLQFLPSLPLPAIASLGGRIAKECGEFLSTNSFALTSGNVVGIVSSISDCLRGVVRAMAATGVLDALTLTRLDGMSGALSALKRLDQLASGVNLGAEIGDLLIAKVTDGPLRQFSVLHAAAFATPAPTTSAPESSSPHTAAPSSGLAVGNKFDSNCVVAWPTAPSYTTQGVQMTMSCDAVPEDQYQFTDVFYPDPNFNFPDTGQVHVRGRVEDVASSDYGYKELVVRADRITKP